MKSNLICMLITIVAYLILMIVVGILASKKNKDTSDFYLGGRKLGPIVTAMSAEASDMSSYLLMGLPGLALLTGWLDSHWSGNRHISQLAVRRKTAANLFSAQRLDYNSRLFLEPLSR